MKTTLKVQGMHCQACVQRVSTAFRQVPGVVAANVSLTPPLAEIESVGPLPADTLARAVRAAGDYSISEVAAAALSGSDATAGASKPSLYPLGLILLYITGTTVITTFVRGTADFHTLLNDFMAGFFLVFSFFKLLDLRGFADAYRSYDILARLWTPWALVYPFIELGLGVSYLTQWQPVPINLVTLALMLVGSIGVFRALSHKETIRCACLGTALNLPMTTVTLTEDLLMAAMAAAVLVWPH